jgi:hypothetical protein
MSDGVAVLADRRRASLAFVSLQAHWGRSGPQ